MSLGFIREYNILSWIEEKYANNIIGLGSCQGD